MDHQHTQSMRNKPRAPGVTAVTFRKAPLQEWYQQRNVQEFASFCENRLPGMALLDHAFGSAPSLGAAKLLHERWMRFNNFWASSVETAGPSMHLHSPRPSDAWMRDVAIPPDLIGRVHNDDPLVAVRGQQASQLSDGRCLSHAWPSQQQDRLSCAPASGLQVVCWGGLSRVASMTCHNQLCMISMGHDPNCWRTTTGGLMHRDNSNRPSRDVSCIDINSRDTGC